MMKSFFMGTTALGWSITRFGYVKKEPNFPEDWYVRAEERFRRLKKKQGWNNPEG